LVIHGGSNNTIVNNVLANASNPPGLDRVVSKKVLREPWGMLYMDASFGGAGVDVSATDNLVRQNIFLYATAGGGDGGVGDGGEGEGGSNNTTIIGAAVPLSPAIAGKEFSGGVRSNLYYNLAHGDGKPLFSATNPQFFNYTFAEWQQLLGFDRSGSSYQGQDPMFVAARTGGAVPGDWRLLPGSPAASLIGFQPPGIYQC
jgi:hypothetical protein